MIFSSPLVVALAVVGTVAGITYGALGIAAIKRLDSANEVDRTVGWTLWWFLEFRRYNAEGKHLCKAGGIVLFIGLSCWIGILLLQIT